MALGRIKWRYYLVYIFINIAYVVYFYFYLIDTRGLPLEEVTMLYDYPRKDARRMAREEMEKRVAAEEERTRGTHKLETANSRMSGEKDAVHYVERV